MWSINPKRKTVFKSKNLKISGLAARDYFGRIKKRIKSFFFLIEIFNDKQENTENVNPEKQEDNVIEEKTVGIINEGIQEDYEPVVKKQDTRNSSEKQNYEKILKILK